MLIMTNILLAATMMWVEEKKNPFLRFVISRSRWAEKCKTRLQQTMNPQSGVLTVATKLSHIVKAMGWHFARNELFNGEFIHLLESMVESESLCYSFWLNRRNTYIWTVRWSFKQIKQVVMIVRTSICHVTRKTSGNLNFSIDRLLRKSPCRKKRKLQRLANGNFLQQMVRETIYENEGMIRIKHWIQVDIHEAHVPFSVSESLSTPSVVTQLFSQPAVVNVITSRSGH